MWFGTQDGLNRYDGYQIKVFKPENDNPHSISHNIVKAFCESSDGILWIGTDGGGLNMYDRKTEQFKAFKHDPNDPFSISNNSVYAVFEDKDGHIWVGTFGGGVCRMNKERTSFTRYVYDPKDPYSLSGNSIRAIFEDPEGSLWIGVDGGGLNKFDPQKKRFIHYRHDPNDPESLASDIVLCVLVDYEGYFWVGSWAGGISKFNPKNGKTIRFKHNPLDPKSINGNETFMFCQDHKKNLWVCTRNGLDRYDKTTNTFIHYKNDPLINTSLSFDVVISLFEDRSGVLWVGTEGGGLSKVDLKKKPFYHVANDYKKKSSLSSNEVVYITQQSDGRFWVATLGGGANLGDPYTNTFELYKFDPNNPNSIASDRVQVIMEDSKGNIWFGTNGFGVTRYNPKTNKYTRFYEDRNDLSKLSNNAIFGIIEDRQGYIWLCTWGGGINRFNPSTETFQRYTIDAQNQMKDVGVCLYEDSDGIIWCGTNGHGLLKYEKSKDKFKYYELNKDANSSISSNVVFYITETLDGSLWIGTGGAGVDKFDKKREIFTNINKAKDGLISDVISSIVPDDKGRLWIATNKGISLYDIKTSKIIKNFDRMDGLQDNSFNQSAAFKTRKGEIFMGGGRGFNYFHPDSIQNNKVSPKVVLTDFKIFNRSVKAGESNILKYSITETQQIKLSYKYNSFSFEFSALHFAVPSKNKFKYMMEGFDKDWIETTSDRRFASYTNLPGGDYTFKVIASNNDGVWSEQGVDLKIKIIAPFWQTIWFYILCGLVLVALLYLIIKVREKASLKQKLELQERINNAVAEVEKQKAEILEQNLELQKRREEDQKRQWFNEGIAKFTDIMRENKDNLNKLSFNVLRNLIRHIDAIQGGIFIINDDNEQDLYLELIASYGYNQEKNEEKRIEIGQGLVGICYKEKKLNKLDNLPDNYLTVESTLGHSTPAQLLLVPLKLDELVFGVIELATFNHFTEIQIDFIQKLSENLTSQLFATKITDKTQKLLLQSQKQAEELKKHEEESRQVIEEMQANKEEAQRLKQEAMGYINSMNHSIIRADFNLDGILTYANTRFLDFFEYNSKEAYGMHITDFFNDEEKADFQEKWDALLNGSKHIEEKYYHKTKTGNIWLLSTFTTVKDLHGNITKVLYMGLDINEETKIRTITEKELHAIDSFLIRVVLDRSRTIIEANQNFKNVFKLEDVDIQDLHFDMLLPSNSLETFDAKWQKIVSGSTEREIFIRKNPDASEFYIDLQYIPITNENSYISKVLL
ncbi:MAG: two-component regulator propeller domain-containing protein, partial [Bacteroidales bacterium]